MIVEHMSLVDTHSAHSLTIGDTLWYTQGTQFNTLAMGDTHKAHILAHVHTTVDILLNTCCCTQSTQLLNTHTSICIQGVHRNGSHVHMLDTESVAVCTQGQASHHTQGS